MEGPERGGHWALTPTSGAPAATPFRKTLATACRQEPPPGAGQPLTLLIADVAAATFGLVVVLPGQEGSLLARKAGDVATRLCAGGCQEVPCGTQTGVRHWEWALSSPFPHFLSLAPSSSNLPLHHPWSALTAPHPSVTHLLGSPCNRTDHPSSVSRGHSRTWMCCPGHGCPAARGEPGGQELLAPSVAVPHGGLSQPSVPSFRGPSICPQSSPLLRFLSRRGAYGWG